MTSPDLIKADGIDWPFQTFVDAYRYRPVEPFEAPRLDGQVRVDLVTVAGELQPCRYASDVRWHDVRAFRLIAGGPESTPCRICGEPCARLDFEDLCSGCEDHGEMFG